MACGLQGGGEGGNLAGMLGGRDHILSIISNDRDIWVLVKYRSCKLYVRVPPP